MEVKQANDGRAGRPLRGRTDFNYVYPNSEDIPNRAGCKMSFCTDDLNSIGNTILLARMMNWIIMPNAMKYLIQLLSLVLIHVL